ncbi:NO-inducible flavohemoprotein [Acetobacter lambici]|uniref:nitric oxide dioxygenase n=1 Tax=Acetobacter lambici TaxID=1332824 RepID=A0ABT1F3E7_9PROT|nr:NO-inducible flavohemoprotein [Acetobacter lambici]MCP1243707.1 NO-inducible flavohemoprotein [Acetobacter lambici]MCP1259747.1 NO-inducible flavohemoprotein [Acetobacter lambici]NHO57960.1 NO-inducible flavohemoprotein [Acetobacter lambici]
MSTMLDDQTRTIVSACVPALEAHGLAITQEMYRRLLSKPEIRDLFNMSHQKDGEQPKALALAVLAYARNINNLGALGGMVERIAEKHVGLNILPEHYPFVGEALLGAIAHVLGDAATPEIMDAWGKAYWFLADVLTGREKQIYQAHAATPGGWTGWRSFTVRTIVVESSTIRSFDLVPTDQKPVMQHQPGQYLSFKLDIPDHGSQRRNYSISSAPASDHYRLSIRKAEGGVVSSWFHDTVREGDELLVSAPAGEFACAPKPDVKTMFISAGIGLTPFMSALGEIEKQSLGPIHFVHGTHAPDTQAFGAYVQDLARKGLIKADIFYSTGLSAEALATPDLALHAGRITPEWLASQIKPDTHYWVCGPDQFMLDMITALKAQGVPQTHIHYEFFGSASDAQLLAAA